MGMLTVANQNVGSGHVVLFEVFFISSLDFHFPLACHLKQLLFCALLCLRLCSCAGGGAAAILLGCGKFTLLTSQRCLIWNIQ